MTNTDVDFQEIEALFTVIEKCVAHSGRHTGIMAAASNRLQEIDETLREAAAEDKREREEAEAAARPRAIPADADEDVAELGDDEPIHTTTTRRL